MLYIDSTTIVTLSALYDTISATYVNDATVTGALKDASGATLYSFSLPYVALSSGNYQGTLPAATTVTLSQTAEYTVEITAVTSNNQLLLVERQLAQYAQ